MYRPVPPQLDLPALDHGVLEFWREHKIFDRSLDQTAAGAPWTFYEGPPTANGRPGTHHVEARVFKDVFPRLRTMQGYHVVRKAGWDCHGLPVELAVEKELGFAGKGDIEAFGIAEFNDRCRESVLRHVGEFRDLTERMGYWVNFDEAYWTMHPGYVESVWWALKQIHGRGLLVEDYRVAPYCPRCGTALSEHELGQEGGYETVVDPSVFVRFPLTSGEYAGRASLLVWTTTPWTLVSNSSVAVHPEVRYVVASNGEESLVVAEPLFETALGAGWTVQSRLHGTDLVHWTYHRPFELVDFPAESPAHFVVLADYVTTEDGTGLVHQSPAFGEDDLRVARAYGLPMVTPVRSDGRFEESVPLVGGQFFKHADADLVADLQARGLLFRHDAYKHSYPHCWRCHTALIYYALPSWYIRTTAIKAELLRENERTNWYPDSIKHGRYGDWLDNNVDWALSRSRYWGTPLPIWRCEQRHETCIGSLAELSELAGSDYTDLDPHRPYVDEVTFACPDCGEPARRVPEVIDGWFDSGSMPFAQWGYPHVDGSAQRLERAYPAQFICEAIDQTRGWFYTLMAVGTLVFDRSSYENVLCLGHILAEDGRKMSKHLGNILEPIPLMAEHGADALRWFMAAGGSPWAPRRIGHATLTEIVRKVLLTYWNTVAFQVLYARSAGWTPATGSSQVVADRPVLDRWLHARTHALVRDVTDALDDYDTQRAGRTLSTFIDDLSNWYVRRSRRRFWDGDPSALATLHETLDVLTRLLAPLVPFVTEQVWQDVVRPVTPDAAESVHLSAWPTYAEAALHPQLDRQVRLARRVVELGRAARAAARVKTRQPLRRALVGSGAYDGLSAQLRKEVAEELNVGALESLGVGSDLVDVSAKGNFRKLGKRFGKDTPSVAAAVAGADAAVLAEDLRTTGQAPVQVEGRTVTVSPDDVIVSERPRAGWSVVNDQGETVALDLELTPALRRAGLAREVVRLVQEARKAAGLDVSDRISLWWRAEGGAELAEAVREHTGLLGDEVLATAVTEGTPDRTDLTPHDDTLGLTFWLARA